jgi:molecular chaperone GrpE
MDPNQETKDLVFDGEPDSNEAASVDDFIRQLEERERDLHITLETTVIEIAESFDDAGNVPDLLAQDLAASANVRGVAAAPARSEPAAQRAHELEAEVERLRSAMAKIESDRDAIFENSKRRAKDLASIKARTERERTDTFQSQVANLATFILPALDNLNRALQSADQLSEAKSPEFQNFVDGVTLVNEQMYDILGKMGIKAIPAVGESFDPHLHEAVAIEERDDLPDNYISDELTRGFCVGERVIRHSMVKVVKSSNSAEAVPATAATDEIAGDRFEID